MILNRYNLFTLLYVMYHTLHIKSYIFIYDKLQITLILKSHITYVHFISYILIFNTLLPGTTPGQDLNLSLDRVTANRNFTNKLWNAAKFVLLNLEHIPEAEWAGLSTVSFSSRDSLAGLQLAEAWIVSALHQVSRASRDTIRPLPAHLGFRAYGLGFTLSFSHK